ncbi:MAG: ComEC/Rec2 family competence protein [Planctomycetota bacterium]
MDSFPPPPNPMFRGRPLPWIAFSLLAGVFVATQCDANLEVSNDNSYVAAHLWFCAAGVFVCMAGSLARGASAFLLIVSSGILGFVVFESARITNIPTGGLARALRDVKDTNQRDTIFVVEGAVRGPVYKKTGRGAWPSAITTFQLDTVAIHHNGSPSTIVSSGVLTVRCEGDAGNELSGKQLIVTGRLRVAAHGMSNAMILTKPGAIQIARGKDPPFDPAAPADRLREGILDILQNRFSGHDLGLAAAITVGTYAFAPQELLESHANTGAIPFLAVSGLNVAFVLAPFLWFLRKTRASPRTALLLILIVIFYAWLAGGASPVARAGWAAALASAAPVLGRRSESLSLLSAGAIIEIFFSPGSAATASFQLSYGAVLGFILFYNSVRARLLTMEALLPKPVRRRTTLLFDALAIGIIAFLTTAGITALHFGRLTPLSPLIGIPLTFIFPPLFFCAWLALLPGFLGAAPAFLFKQLASLELAIVEFADRAPGTPAFAGALDPAAIAFVALGVLLFISNKKLLAVSCAAVGLLQYFDEPKRNPDSVYCIFHPVGHGLAATVLMPGGANLQIDAGSLDDAAAANRIILPALQKLRIRRFSICSISHADADHANAFPGILNYISTDAWTAAPGNLWNAAMERATGKPRFDVRNIENGGAVARWFEIAASDAKDNNNAYVTILNFGGRTLLFSGDLEHAGAVELLQQIPELRCDILVLPHHGLNNGQVEILAGATRPQIAVASCGFRYKTTETDEILQLRGIPVFTTRDHGTLVIELRRNGEVLLTSGIPKGM